MPTAHFSIFNFFFPPILKLFNNSNVRFQNFMTFTFNSMATSAFRSTTKRASPGSGGSGSSSTRRSRSLSRFSPETDYSREVPRGKFVNTTRGSGSPFPEISLDDLALEFFSSSSNNGNESDAVAERKDRLGRWASDTASSRRKARSLSRSRGGGGVVPSNSTSGGKNAVGSRRRRSLSVARYQISDSESEVDNLQDSSEHTTVKAPTSWNTENPLGRKTAASSNRRMGRQRSHKKLSMLRNGYSNHSSALTDDGSKGSHFEESRFEKIIRTVYAEKSEYPTVDDASGRIHEAMRNEIRCAVEEICTELNQTMERNQKAVTTCDLLHSENLETLQDSSGIKEKYASNLDQPEKHKQELLTELLVDEQQGQEVFKVWEEHPNSRTLVVADKSSHARKRSSDRSRISENLIDEADHIFEDFIGIVEDISSLDGERSDGNSTLGETTMTRDSETLETEPYRTPVEMDGVVLPWLQWETSHDGSLLRKSKARTSVTPKALNWDSEKDMVWCNGQRQYSISSHGSWSPGTLESPQMNIKQDTSKTKEVSKDSSLSYFDMAEYKRLEKNEGILFEMYKQHNRINSGGLLLCTGIL